MSRSTRSRFYEYAARTLPVGIDTLDGQFDGDDKHRAWAPATPAEFRFIEREIAKHKNLRDNFKDLNKVTVRTKSDGTAVKGYVRWTGKTGGQLREDTPYLVLGVDTSSRNFRKRFREHEDGIVSDSQMTDTDTRVSDMTQEQIIHMMKRYLNDMREMNLMQNERAVSPSRSREADARRLVDLAEKHKEKVAQMRMEKKYADDIPFEITAEQGKDASCRGSSTNETHRNTWKDKLGTPDDPKTLRFANRKEKQANSYGIDRTFLWIPMDEKVGSDRTFCVAAKGLTETDKLQHGSWAELYHDIKELVDLEETYHNEKWWPEDSTGTAKETVSSMWHTSADCAALNRKECRSKASRPKAFGGDDTFIPGDDCAYDTSLGCAPKWLTRDSDRTLKNWYDRFQAKEKAMRNRERQQQDRSFEEEDWRQKQMQDARDKARRSTERERRASSRSRAMPRGGAGMDDWFARVDALEKELKDAH